MVILPLALPGGMFLKRQATRMSCRRGPQFPSLLYRRIVALPLPLALPEYICGSHLSNLKFWFMYRFPVFQWIVFRVQSAHTYPSVFAEAGGFPQLMLVQVVHTEEHVNAAPLWIMSVTS